MLLKQTCRFATLRDAIPDITDRMLSERLQSIDLRAHLRRRRTYPGVFPVLHLDHIYYEGRVEVVKVELPRTRLSLMASQVSDAFNTKTRVNADAVWNGSMLPSKAELNVLPAAKK